VSVGLYSLWWWGLFKILFSLVLSLMVAVGGGAELAAAAVGGGLQVAGTAGGVKEMAGSSGTEARQFYLLMSLFAGENQTHAAVEIVQD
jgi:hypothetical protein